MDLENEMIFPKMEKSKRNKLREKIFEVIFESDTFHGKLFNVILLITILMSVVLVMLESVQSINEKYHRTLIIFEWIITGLFTIEYFLRLYSVRKPWKYFFSFYGIIDLLSIFPTYLGIFYPSTKYLANLRVLRLFRIFRIFGLTDFLRGGNVILIALKNSRAKIIVFLSFVTLVVVVIGSFMYVVERNHPESGFTSIPVSIYWAVVTLTTVGYGDIVPVTAFGKFLASIVMILGYGVIAVPTGIVTAEVVKRPGSEPQNNTQVCQNCHDAKHMDGAKFCKSCGFPLHR